MPDHSKQRSLSRTIFLLLLFVISAGLALIALVIPLLESYRSPAVEVGQVAWRDYRAPRALAFESQVLTAQRRDGAERSVAPIYTAPDTRVARQQLERLRAALAYITSVRADVYAVLRVKLEDLAALEDMRLSQEMATTILGLTDSRWQEIGQEAIEVLEKVMSGVVRPDTEQAVRDGVPTLVSLSLTEAQATIVTELVAAFVTSNSQYSESMTEAARQKARASVEPVIRTFVPGQTVVSSGQVLRAEDIEALVQLGLAQPELRWQDLVSAAALAGLLTAFMLIYLHRKQGVFAGEMRSLMLIAVLFLVFLISVRLVVHENNVIAYAFPLAAYSLTVGALFSPELALVTTLPLTILAAYGMPNALNLTIYYAVGSLFGVLALGRARRLIAFFWAGAAIMVSGAITILIYTLPVANRDTVELAALVGAAFVNGLASASITILLQFILAQFMGTTTPMQLMDLTRPDHPLLRLLLREAPGTYQHSLQVANLAEQAAERIGADALLTRVGALYHDVGKAVNPGLFIENQPPGLPNPHSAMEPEESASLIIRHVADGLDLGRRYRLPQHIINFITEHHGTMIARYQYVNAVKAAGGDESQVDIEKYRYPGPPPQSRETAILMLADGSEARVRAERPADEQALRDIVKEVVNHRISNGQLDETKLTLRDLNQIVDSFTVTLRSIYHPRVQYPKLETAASAEADTIPIAQRTKALADAAVEPPGIEQRSGTS